MMKELHGAKRLFLDERQNVFCLDGAFVSDGYMHIVYDRERQGSG
jgi:hypothetical protein